MANAWVPVPGWWTGSQWRGMIPFEEMPVLRDPDAGFVAGEQGQVAAPAVAHYIGLDYAPGFGRRGAWSPRDEALEKATADDMAAIHAAACASPRASWSGCSDGCA